MTRGSLSNVCPVDGVASGLAARASEEKTARSAALWRAAQRGMPTVGASARCLGGDHPTGDAARVFQEACRVHTALQEALVKGYERCLAWDHPTWNAARVSQEARRVYTAVQEALVKGTVVVATRFGRIAAAYFAADLVAHGASDIYALVHHPAWADQVGLVGGPFCVPVWDDEVPF